MAALLWCRNRNQKNNVSKNSGTKTYGTNEIQLANKLTNCGIMGPLAGSHPGPDHTVETVIYDSESIP